MEKYNHILDIVKSQFKLNIDGDHGLNHWKRVYEKTKILSGFYKVESDVFELFSLLHDSKRENEYEDINHGKRASLFIKELYQKGEINLSKDDLKRLIFACSNHTKSNKNAPLYNDLIVQICFDSDKLDIGRVGIIPEEEYFQTSYAKQLIKEEKYYYPF